METCFECKSLSKRFGNVQALDEVNISIMPGRVIGLLGPNGSGKTTLIKLANGLLTPSSGEISVCGFKPGKESKALVSYLPDRPCLPEWITQDSSWISIRIFTPTSTARGPRKCFPG